MDCIFCEIIRGERTVEKIYENEYVLAFLDANPLAPGHTLVIPKTHFFRISDLDEGTAGELFKLVLKVNKAIKESINPDAFTVGINDGKAAGQAVPHLHIHIIPRFKADGGATIHSIVRNPPEEDLHTIAEKIKSVFEEEKVEEKEEEKPEEKEEETTGEELEKVTKELEELIRRMKIPRG
jgi:histidine triad (HIT) family protein